MEAAVRLEHDLVAVETDEEVHAMLEITVPEAATADDRPSLDLSLVLDCSGSMAGEKLDAAKQAADWLVERLRPTDKVALVAYDSEVSLLAPLAAAGSSELGRAIASLRSGSMTNLSGGWLRGLGELERGNGGATRKILLLTDGLANEGITDPDQLVSLATGARGRGVGTTTIGFGDDFDEDLLTKMADAGGGKAHYAATPEAAPAIFADELEGLTSLAAQNVTLEIRPTADVEMFSILNDYPQVGVDGGVQVELGDAYGGERRRVVFTLHVPALSELGVVKVAEVVLRYVTVGEDVERHEVTLPVVLNLVSADEAAAREPDLQVREEVLRLSAATARAEAIELADAGRYDDAQAVLRRVELDLRSAGFTQEADALQLDVPKLSPIAYTSQPRNRKQLRYEQHRRQRGRQPR